MIDRDWQVLEDAFAVATALDAEERGAFVDRFAAEYPGLADQLKAMLAADPVSDKGLRGSIARSLEKLAGYKWRR